MSPSVRRLLALLALAPVPLAGGSLLLTGACDIKPEEGYDRQAVLRGLTRDVIVPTYAGLADNTVTLQDACSALRAAPSAETLARARRAYESARARLKTSEAFAFGPIEDLALTAGAIDSWPADRDKLEAVVTGPGAVDPARVGTLGANQRGFPALEHLLYDSVAGDAAVLARFTDAATGARRAALTESVAIDLAGKCRAVASAWDLQAGYGRDLAEAGLAGTTFRTQSEGIDKVATGLVYVTELMVMRKLAGPLGVEVGGAPQPALEEAARSDLSLADLRDNLLGIRAIYEGSLGAGSGSGLAGPVRTLNPGVAARFEQALASALAAVDAVPPPFRVALVQNRASLEALYQSVRTLKQLIVTELAGTLGASLGFGYSDTD